MSHTIFNVSLRTERDVVQARQRARELAELLGFDNQDQIRLATATSEIARNAFRYARNGNVRFSVDTDSPQQLKIVVSDSGPGIADLERILDGGYKSDTGLGMGILGTRRLMDRFEIRTSPQGTTAELGKRLPANRAPVTQRAVTELAKKMQARTPDSPYEEIEQQNQELLKMLEELRSRQEELELLNRELEDTNRGVVALYAELDERADYLRRASELKTKFLSNVSHEFRTPLNSIISLARLLMDRIDGDLTAGQQKQIHYIESSARDLQELVNDLLDLAKVEAGKIKMRPKNFEVEDLFSALKGMLKPLLADNASIELCFEDPVGVPPLHTDEGKVSQILRNLISNALKFTPRGRVTVSAKRSGTDSVLFSVADTGIGIPSEHHETIFREFSQLENPLQERLRGTGLGLPLCRNLGALLGGSIWLSSKVGEGSTFFVKIPIRYVGEDLSRSEELSLPAPEFHRMPVLILEDNPQTASLLESFMRNSEFQPIVATQVAQAEDWLARHTPAAMVSDIYLNSDPAWEFFASVRDRFPSLPMILTSVYEELDQAHADDADVFLHKPVSREILLQTLRRLTSNMGTRRLLIVDDNEVSRYIVREILDQPWLDIREAGNGSEALRLIAEERPDALILDLLMPDMSGLAVLRRLREQAATADLPVMIYTSKTLSDSEKLQLESLRTCILRKEDVSTRLSAQPFLEWLRDCGLAPGPLQAQPNT